MAKSAKSNKQAESFLNDLHGKFDIVRKWKRESISTGVLALDQATSKGGMPRGLVIDLYGDEGLGKTTLVLAMMAERVRCGEICAFIDVEHGLQPGLVLSIIPDTFLDKEGNVRHKDGLFHIYQPGNPSGEETFKLVDRLLKEPAVRMIAVDSIAALAFAEDLEEDKYTSPIGLQARRIGAFTRRILGIVYEFGTLVLFVNQMRLAPNTYGPMLKTSTGGKAIRFYAALRINMTAEEKIMRQDVMIGQRVKLKLEKNKIGIPQRHTSISIMYGRGVDRARDLIDTGLEMGMIVQSGGWYKLNWGKQEITAHGEADLAEKILPHLDAMRIQIHQQIAEKATKDDILPPVADDAEVETETEAKPEVPK